MWVVKSATLIFKSFCSNVAKKVSHVYCLFYRSLRYDLVLTERDSCNLPSYIATELFFVTFNTYFYLISVSETFVLNMLATTNAVRVFFACYRFLSWFS